MTTRFLLIHDPNKVSLEKAHAHAIARGLSGVATGIPPWLEHTGQVPSKYLDGDGYCVVMECDKHPYEVLAVVPHGDVRASDLVKSCVCTTVDHEPEAEPIDVSGLPLPFQQALRDLVNKFATATRDGKLIPAGGALLKFK